MNDVPGAGRGIPADSGPGACPWSVHWALTKYVLPALALVGTVTAPVRLPKASTVAAPENTMLVDGPGPRKKSSAVVRPLVGRQLPVTGTRVEVVSRLMPSMIAVPLAATAATGIRTTRTTNRTPAEGGAHIFRNVCISTSLSARGHPKTPGFSLVLLPIGLFLGAYSGFG